MSPPGNADRRPDEGRRIGEQTNSTPKSTDQVGQAQRPAPTFVYPEVHVVRGRDRDRLELLVRCPRCQAVHSHRAPVTFISGARTSACGLRYVVVAGLVRAVAA